MFKKHFWQTYVNDYARFYFIFGIGVAVFLLLTVIMGRIPWGFIVGYTLMDPFSYYMTGYQRVLRNEAIARRWRNVDRNAP
jgi:hypothetical protein